MSNIARRILGIMGFCFGIWIVSRIRFYCTVQPRLITLYHPRSPDPSMDHHINCISWRVETIEHQQHQTVKGRPLEPDVFDESITGTNCQR